MVDEVAPTHVDHRPHGDEGAEAHHFLEAPIQHGGAQRAALADESDRSGPGNGGGEGGVQAGKRAHYTQAVRADHTNAGLLRLVQQLALEFSALRSDFFETGRDHHGALDAILAALPNDSRNGRRRRDDDRQVNLLREIRYGLIRFHAQDAGAFRVHRVDSAAERTGDQVPQQCSSDCIGSFRRADDRHGFRRKEDVQRLMTLAPQLLT